MPWNSFDIQTSARLYVDENQQIYPVILFPSSNVAILFLKLVDPLSLLNNWPLTSLIPLA